MWSLPLFTLALAAFGIGTTEFVIMGLLPDVARDLGVGIPSAGMLVTGYALSVAIGSPIVAILTAGMERRKALLLLMLFFIGGNLFCALAPNYGVLMLARVITALCHGAFFGIGSVVAAGLVPPNKRAQAISLMFAGLTLANVLGVPFGTALGQHYGWRTTFGAVTGIGLVAIVALWLWLPRRIAGASGSFLREFGVLKNMQVVLVLLISVCASASLFAVFTYITPILEDITGVTPHQVTLILLVFGVGLTIGSVLGGRLADWRPLFSLVFLLMLIALLMLVFPQVMPYRAPMVAMILVWGILGFAVVPASQLLVVDRAAEAPNLASTLNQGAFNLGNASGAWMGALAINADWPLTRLPLVSMAATLAGIILVIISAILVRRVRRMNTAVVMHR